MYERLTGRDNKGVYYRHGKESGIQAYADRPPHDCIEAIDRLAELEDKLESGELVEVTRCKNCTYWDADHDNSIIGYCASIKNDIMTHKDSFCSRGERKTL